MSPSELLAKKLKLWYVANEPRPSPVPEVKVDSNLPTDAPATISFDREIANQLAGLRVFEDRSWDGVCRDMSGMLARLSEASRQRLLDSLSLISAAPPIDAHLARRWIWAVSTLLPSTYSTGIMEFFQLAWMWDQVRTSAGMEMDRVLAVLYRALRAVGEGPRSAAMVHFLIQLAGRWPERFCYWLERTSIGGPDVIQALKRAESLLPEAAPHAQESLLDFAAEMGWRFMADEHMPLWRAVGRLGEPLFRRLRATSVPPQTLDLLAGLLGEMESQGSLVQIMADVRLRVVSGMFAEKDMAVVQAALDAVPEVHRAIEAVGELELITQVSALRGNLQQPFRTGAALVRLACMMGGGRPDLSFLLGLLEKFQGQLQEGQLLEAVDIANDFKDRLPLHSEDEWFRLIRLLGFAGTDQEIPRQVRNAAARVFEAIAFCPAAAQALEAIELSFTIPGLDSGDVFQAAALVVRGASPEQVPAVLQRTGDVANLLGLLIPEERDRLHSTLPPHWLSRLAAEEAPSLGKVASALEKVQTRSLRLRFLENVVAPVLEELNDRGEVFEEYLTAAATEYNKTPGQETALRDAENDLLQRLFRTGDRTRVLESVISDLLRMSGLEKERSSALVEVVKTVCASFSRQAVWQDPSDTALPGFMQKGLPRLVRALVDWPDMLDSVNSQSLQALMEKIMPSASGGDTDPQVARWQTRTGVVFFGQILPVTIELFPEDPPRVAGFAYSLSEQAVRTSQGVVAGAAYLAEASMRLEQILIDCYSARFQAFLTGGKALPPDLPLTWATDLYETWTENRAPEAVLVREAAQLSRTLTADRRLQRLFTHEAKKLWEGLYRAGLMRRPALLRPGGAALVQQLAETVEGDLLSVFRRFERGEEVQLSPTALDRIEKLFAKKASEKPGENACRAWRLEAFTPLGAVLTDLVLLENSRQAQIDQLTESFLEVSEFLGTETGGEELLLAFERCLSVGEGGHFTPTAREALRLLDKQLFRPLWRRRAMSRVELMLMGMGDRDRLVDRLLDRLSKEPGVVSQVRFLRRFGQLFLVVEDACQGIGDPRREVFAREAMSSVWLFSGTGRHSEFAPESAREAYEAVLEVFRSLRRAEGEVTAAQAEEISVEMKRKYRDNAEVVAILLRWTLDPAREEMLHLLEEHPPLLEAAGRDTDLMRLLDTVARDERVLGLVRTLASEPETLKMRLREIA
ncbi:hypothetical protein GX411_05320 [Candidatus Fermentibacteria bacterium]|nr:hypothetical protein [Candidatus Fermentibacteria bacterium]